MKPSMSLLVKNSVAGVYDSVHAIHNILQKFGMEANPTTQILERATFIDKAQKKEGIISILDAAKIANSYKWESVRMDVGDDQIKIHQSCKDADLIIEVSRNEKGMKSLKALAGAVRATPHTGRKEVLKA